MTRRTIEDLIAQANTSLPDNNQGAIKPADVRGMILDFLDTVTPMYGGLHILSSSVALDTTPIPLVFQDSMASFPPEWSTDPALGQLSRQLGSVQAMTSRFTINGDVDGAAAGDLLSEIYRNGVPTGWRSLVATVRGIGKPVTFVIDAIDYVTADAMYELRVSTSVPGVYNFSNVQFIGVNIPVRSSAAPPGTKLA